MNDHLASPCSKRSSEPRRDLRPHVLVGLFGVTALVAAAGCNAILDNKPAKLDPAALSSEGSPTLPLGDAGGPGQCGPGNHTCNNVCVSATDPTYGCGASSCESCSAPHATAACQANGCAIAACDRGFADCNNDPSDGCEVDLSKATSCGSCNAVCPPANPICAPVGDSFQCGTGCAPSAPLLCGTECVSPLTSANHCGSCDVKCADVANGQVTCEGGACKVTCKASYHACGAKCVVDTDPLQCGPACTACPVPANAVAACAANACAFQCNAGFGDCNKDAKDGCEAIFASDALNCGACGKSCNGGRCVTGVCVPVDAGP